MAAGIFAAFSVLLCLSVYVAERMQDGTVEEHYYRKSREFFRKGGPAAPSPVPGRFTALAGGQKILLDIGPTPVRAMKELTFSVEAPGYVGPGIPWIDLGMSGMRMPPNRIYLRREGDGRYRGTGVLFSCPSGMRTWKATVNLPGTGKAVVVFDVSD